MSDGRQPLAVFLCATRAHVEDALSVAAHLPGTCWLVTLRAESAEFIRSAAPAGSNLVVREGGQSKTRLGKLGTLLRSAAIAWRAVRSGSRPVFVFGDDVNAVEAAMVRIVRLCGASSVLVQDGFLYEYDLAEVLRAQPRLTQLSIALLRLVGLMPRHLTMYGTGGCNVLALYSEHTRALLERRHVERRSMRVVGAPRFDGLIALRDSSVRESGPRPRRRVLYLGVMVEAWGGGNWDLDQRWIDAVCALAADRPEWQIVLRPHPSEDMERYRDHLSRTPVRAAVEIDRQRPLPDLLLESDVVVMHHASTVLFEAVVVGVPVIYLHLGLEARAEVEIPVEVIPRALPGQPLADAIAAMMTEPARAAWLRKQSEYVENRLGFLDGHSARRVSALIEEEWVRMNAG
jgi:hypothetical protein